VSNYTDRRGKRDEQIPAADLAKEDALYFLRHARPKDKPFALTVGTYCRNIGEKKKQQSARGKKVV
jgi:hypothetical protein